MPLEVIHANDNFRLARENHGLRLVVNCAERLAAYNAAQVNLPNFFEGPLAFPQVDAHLYQQFANAAELHALGEAIRRLEAAYNLRGYLTNRDIPALLINHLPAVRDVNGGQPICIETINVARQAFVHWSGQLQIPPTAEVNASKLFHFVNPNVFWIIDNRVKTVLEVWGYDPSFDGFGEFLMELMHHEHYQALHDFLVRQNGQECPFLKLLDKALLG